MLEILINDENNKCILFERLVLENIYIDNRIEVKVC